MTNKKEPKQIKVALASVGIVSISFSLWLVLLVITIESVILDVFRTTVLLLSLVGMLYIIYFRQVVAPKILKENTQ